MDSTEAKPAEQLSQETKSPAQSAIQEAIELVDRTPVSIVQRAKFVLAQAHSMSFPTPEREQQAAARIREFARVAIECARQYAIDAFDREQTSFRDDLRRLALPIVIPTFSEHLALYLPRLNHLGWLSSEAEALRFYADGGLGGTDRIVNYTVNDVTLASGKTVNRVQIREELRPRWQPIDEWHESREFAQMQQAHELSVANERTRQAEQVVRISSGPARMIGKPVAA